MSRVLVTGASGLLGRQLCLLLAQEHEVHAVVRNSSPRSDSLAAAGAKIHILDLASFDSGSLPAADVVVHLAQSSRYRDFPGGATDVEAINVRATTNLAVWAASNGVTKFVYASTGSVYSPSFLAHSETEPIGLDGHGLYAASKLSGELIVRSFGQFYRTLVLRPFFMFGSEQQPSMLMRSLVTSVRERKTIKLNGEQSGLICNPIWVSDAARIVSDLITGSEADAVVNLAGDLEVSLRTVAENIGYHLSEEPIFEHTPGPKQAVLADNSLRAQLTTRKALGLNDGIAELCKR